jgi:cytochrome c oxidase assembly protein subunit 15
MVYSASFKNYSILVLVFVFLVIIAGGIVRMTQSGMGCPNWPKCFGMWVPPTNASQLPDNYTSYLKQQDIDHTFNVYHTWTEYINRLIGALLGLLLIIQLGWGIALFWKKNKPIVWFCVATVLLTGFQGWLGKRVVDANLATAKITTHMLVALVIAILALTIVYLQKTNSAIANKKIKTLAGIALLLLTVQIILGTGVREQIDAISKSLQYTNRNFWIEKLNFIFYIHRSFSLIIAALCLYMYVQLKKTNAIHNGIKLVIISVFAEIIIGIIMAYASIPAIAQPLHLLFSTGLFVSLFYCWLSNTTIGKQA